MFEDHNRLSHKPSNSAPANACTHPYFAWTIFPAGAPFVVIIEMAMTNTHAHTEREREQCKLHLTAWDEV